MCCQIGPVRVPVPWLYFFVNKAGNLSLFSAIVVITIVGYTCGISNKTLSPIKFCGIVIQPLYMQ